MKKFLLLGVAALSLNSTGANATDYSTASLTASVDVVHSTALTGTEVKFGKIVIKPGASGDITATMDTDECQVEIEGDSAYATGTAECGAISLESTDSMFTSSSVQTVPTVTLTSSDGPNITYVPAISEASLSHVTGSLDVGGTLTIPSTASGSYIGNFTLDVIYDTCTGHSCSSF